MRIAPSRLLIAAAAVASLATAGAAVAAPGGSSKSNWHVGYYNNSGRALSEAQAASTPAGPQLAFTSEDNTALLTTGQGSQKGNLLGDLRGKTITAVFTVAGATGAFTYYGEPDGCGSPANARLYFNTSNAGGFDYTHYWWSNPYSAVLANGTLTVTATVDPAQWSDWNGQFGTTEPAGFDAAAANVTDMGLSFGGGCFFENGVGTTDGSGTLTLNSMTVS